ncbi:polysaccharide deacetylase family protein [Marinactinospora thermotolerans]
MALGSPRLRRVCAIASALLAVVLVLAGTRAVMNARSFQFYGGIVHRVETQDRVVALTFDDGPSEHTDEVLATLADLGVPATFFLTGRELEERPDLGRRIAAAGHQIGNHSYSHQRMVLRSPEFIAEEIERTDAAIRATGYSGEIVFRPPNGKKLVALPRYLDATGRTTVTWEVEPDSAGTSDAAAITRQTLREVGPGSIVLLHPMYGARQATRDAIRPIVEGLQADGYRLVTVEELIAAGTEG